MSRTFEPLIALLSGVALLMLGHGLLGTVLAVRGGLEGFGSQTLGAIGAMYFVGFLVGTYLAPRMIQRVGHVRAFAFFTALAESGEAAPRLARMSSTTFDAQLDVATRVVIEGHDDRQLHRIDHAELGCQRFQRQGVDAAFRAQAEQVCGVQLLAALLPVKESSIPCGGCVKVIWAAYSHDPLYRVISASSRPRRRSCIVILIISWYALCSCFQESKQHLQCLDRSGGGKLERHKTLSR